MTFAPQNASPRPFSNNKNKNKVSRILSSAAVLAVSAGMFSVSPATAADSIPSSFTVNGSGWGHGVGMSQYGAFGMAQEGYTSTQILEHYYNPAKVTSSASYASSDIAVQLIKAGTANITPSNGKLRVRVGSATYETTTNISFKVNGSNISVTVNGKTYTSAKIGVEWEGTRYWPIAGKTTTVTVPNADGGSSNGVYRHGKITVSNLGGQVNVVNSLRLNDEYLYGLAEVPSSWANAALQAQAIAGRTYAMRNMSSLKSGCGCNVYDEVMSQKFTGWKKENESGVGGNWKNAVNGTQKKVNGVPVSASVVTYNGGLIEAVYSSSTGGKTRAGASVWGTNTPYLQSRDDRWALKPSVGNYNASWSYNVTQSQAAANFGLNNVSSINVNKNADGTIANAVAKNSTGTSKTLTGAQFLSKFPNKAAWITSVSWAGSSTPAPVNVAADAIAAKYAQNTGLGKVTSGVVTGLKNGGAYRNYERGAIMWSPATGAKVSVGAIRTKWAATGYENGRLGYPTTDEVASVNGGVYQNYQNGAIVWTPATGARVSFGAVRTNWVSKGAEKGIMGYPTSDEVVSVKGGVWQNYQGGAILWSPATGAKASSNGLIRSAWLANSAERGRLGYPTSEKTGGLKNGGMYQNFEGGSIIYSPTTGAKLSVGAIRTKWAATGYENGRLGYPTSNEYVVNGIVVQDYQGGKITWTSAKGTVITYK